MKDGCFFSVPVEGGRAEIQLPGLISADDVKRLCALIELAGPEQFEGPQEPDFTPGEQTAWKSGARHRPKDGEPCEWRVPGSMNPARVHRGTFYHRESPVGRLANFVCSDGQNFKLSSCEWRYAFEQDAVQPRDEAKTVQVSDAD